MQHTAIVWCTHTSKWVLCWHLLDTDPCTTLAWYVLNILESCWNHR